MHGEKPSDSGSLLIGDKGTLLCGPRTMARRTCFLPAKDFEGYKEPEPYLPRHGKGNQDDQQKKEWIAACKAEKPELALANFEYAGMLTEAILLGNVAIQAGKKIIWDGPNLRVANAPKPAVRAQRYRKGWDAFKV